MQPVCEICMYLCQVRFSKTNMMFCGQKEKLLNDAHVITIENNNKKTCKTA